MKNKKFFLNDMVNIGLCAAVGFGTIYSMDLTMMYNTNPVITFKSLEGLPCFSLSRINKLWAKLPEDKKQKTTKLIAGTNDERLITVFNVATQLPSELHTRIISWMFNGNKQATKFFIDRPLIYSLERYIFSQHVMDDLRLNRFTHNAVPESEDLKAAVRIDTVFEHLDNLGFLRLQDPQYLYTRKELATIDKVAKVFPSIDNQKVSVGFAYRDAYIPSNIWKNIDHLQLVQLIGLAIISPILDDQWLMYCSLLGSYTISSLLLFTLAGIRKTKYQSVKIDCISDLLNDKDIVIS